MRKPPGRRALPALLSILLIASCVTASCVTERSRPTRGLHFRNPSTSRVTLSSPITANPYGLPTIPADDPAQRRAQQIAQAVQHIGVIPYDGLTLPLVSPDGLYLAVQQGSPPDWPTILGLDDAQTPLRTTLAIYNLPPPDDTLTEPPAAALTPGPAIHFDGRGIVLGRSADHRGALVEIPQADASRTIALLQWDTGDLVPLVQDAFCNLHATFGPDGCLVYTRRQPGSPFAELVYLPPNAVDALLDPTAEPPAGFPDAVEPDEAAAEQPADPQSTSLVLSLPKTSILYPVFGVLADRFAVILADARGMTLATIHLHENPPGYPASLTIVDRLPLASPGKPLSLGSAYQAVVGSQTPWPFFPPTDSADLRPAHLRTADASDAPPLFHSILVFSAALGEPLLVDLLTGDDTEITGSSYSLVPAPPFPDSEGEDVHGWTLIEALHDSLAVRQLATLGTPSEQPVSGTRNLSALPAVELVRIPYIPRLTTRGRDPRGRCLLIGPSPETKGNSPIGATPPHQDSARLELAWLRWPPLNAR